MLASPVLGAAIDLRRAERSVGSPAAPVTSLEYFSLTCPHCAAFARESFPVIKAKWIVPGKLRWVFYDFPTDQLALRAAVVARYLPLDRYERFIDTLFATQDRWAFSASDQDQLWPLASDAGMDRATYDAARGDKELRDWMLGRALDAENKWHVDATPSFLVNGKLYEGAMPASEFGAILAG